MRDYLAIYAALVERDGDRCYICGYPPLIADPLQIEHVRSRSHGGSDDLDNLRLAHGSCNRVKGAATFGAQKSSDA